MARRRSKLRDGSSGTVHGDDLFMVEGLRGIAGGDHGRNAVLADDQRGVRGGVAADGDDRGRNPLRSRRRPVIVRGWLSVVWAAANRCSSSGGLLNHSSAERTGSWFYRFGRGESSGGIGWSCQGACAHRKSSMTIRRRRSMPEPEWASADMRILHMRTRRRIHGNGCRLDTRYGP